MVHTKHFHCHRGKSFAAYMLCEEARMHAWGSSFVTHAESEGAKDMLFVWNSLSRGLCLLC